MVGKWSNLILLIFFPFLVMAQCKYVVNEIDQFDSTQLVIMPTINAGFIIPTEFETVDGVKLVEEAKIILGFTEDDKSDIASIFMMIGVLEREYLKVEEGENVMIAFADSTVIGLYNVPDKGRFDKGTNMRVYQHTTFLPLDIYYKCTNSEIIGIRIRYPAMKRDIVISPRQSQQLRSYLQCMGEAVGLFPLDP